MAFKGPGGGPPRTVPVLTDEHIEKELKVLERDYLIDRIDNGDDANIEEALQEVLMIAKLVYSDDLWEVIDERRQELNRIRDNLRKQKVLAEAEDYNAVTGSWFNRKFKKRNTSSGGGGIAPV